MSDSSPDGSRSSLDCFNGASAVDQGYDISSLKNLRVMQVNDQIRELQTIIRDKSTSRSDFLFYSNRLVSPQIVVYLSVIRLVVEEGLNCLPSFTLKVTTPTGCVYEGEWFEKNNCAVSILRSGEAMEKGLRDCCRSMRIGKILIRRHQDTKEPQVYYAKFPPNIESRKILLLLPVLETGATVKTAITVLKEHGVHEKNIFLVTLFSTPRAAVRVLTQHFNITMLTSEIHEDSPSHFSQKYFGSD